MGKWKGAAHHHKRTHLEGVEVVGIRGGDHKLHRPAAVAVVNELNGPDKRIAA